MHRLDESLTVRVTAPTRVAIRVEHHPILGTVRTFEEAVMTGSVHSVFGVRRQQRLGQLDP